MLIWVSQHNFHNANAISTAPVPLSPPPWPSSARKLDSVHNGVWGCAAEAIGFACVSAVDSAGIFAHFDLCVCPACLRLALCLGAGFLVFLVAVHLCACVHCMPHGLLVAPQARQPGCSCIIQKPTESLLCPFSLPPVVTPVE